MLQSKNHVKYQGKLGISLYQENYYYYWSSILNPFCLNVLHEMTIYIYTQELKSNFQPKCLMGICIQKQTHTHS